MPNSYRKMQQVCRLIPAGCVASYGQVAALAGVPRGARIVGRALGADPDRDTLPWHRVLLSDGRLAFAQDSQAFATQRDRLVAEGVLVRNGRVNMTTHRWQPSVMDLAFGFEDNHDEDAPD